MDLEGVNRLSGWWWEHILHASWQAAIVGGLVLLLVHSVGRRWPAPLRYALLVVALLKFAYPPLLPLPTGLFSQFVTAKIVLPAAPERKPPSTTDFRATEATRALGVGGPGLAHLAGAIPWAGWLMIVHSAGALFIGIGVATQAYRLRVVAKAPRSRLDSPLRDEYRNLAIGLGVYRIPPLTISEEVPAPMAFGMKNPAILLPAKLLGGLSSDELRTVLAHELAHCQRGDLWFNGLQLLLLALWWFHPVVWLLHRALRDVREDCCDDLLLARGLVSNDGYCDLLLRAAAELAPSMTLSAGLGLGDKLHPLARRLARISDWTLQRSETVSYAGTLAVVLAAGLLLPGVRCREMDVESDSRPGTATERAALTAAKPLPAPSTRLAAASGTALTKATGTSAVKPLTAARRPASEISFTTGPVLAEGSPFKAAVNSPSPAQPKSNSIRMGPAGLTASARAASSRLAGPTSVPVGSPTNLQSTAPAVGASQVRPTPGLSQVASYSLPQPLSRSIVRAYPIAGPHGGVRVVTVHYYLPGWSVWWWRTPET